MMNEDDFLKSANELLQYLCDKFGLNYIEVRAEKFDGWNKFRPSKFCSDRNYIAINELFLDSNNRNIDLNDKEPSNIAHFYTQNNNLKTFKLKLNNSENPKSIMFQQNLLENIPEEIRCNRNYNGYNIEITSSYRIIENN